MRFRSARIVLLAFNILSWHISLAVLVHYAEAVLAGLITERGGQITFARSCGSGNNEVLVVEDELHSGKPLDLITVGAPLEGIADIIQSSVVTELGGSDRPFNSSVLTVVSFTVNQMRCELVLVHFLFDSVLQRVLKSVVHTKEAHLAQFL